MKEEGRTRRVRNEGGRQVGGEHGMREGVSGGGREDREGRNEGGESMG